MEELHIDEEFRRLIPALSPDERRQLEENILSDGCRDPLVVWRPRFWRPSDLDIELDWESPTSIDSDSDGDHSWEFREWNIGGAEYNDEDWPRILIDGHNRYEICTRLEIHFEVIEKDFENREEAKRWIITNQLGRRNLSPEQLSMFRGMLYNSAKKQQGGTGANQYKQNGQNVHSATAQQLATQLGVDEKTIRRDGKFAEAVEVLGMEDEVAAGELAAPKAAVIEAAKPIIEATKAHQKWEEEVKQSPFAPPPEPPKPTVDDVQKAKAHVSHNSGENEWYTPPEFIESARAVMGSIDCDPATSEIANKRVGATRYFTKDDNGLEQEWVGNVWMNPPYAQPLIAHFSEAVSSKYESSEIASAIVLVNNATETAWFQRMAGASAAVCFPKSRIRFLDPQGNPGAPLQGQAILYFGDDYESFLSEFAKYGSVYRGV